MNSMTNAVDNFKLGLKESLIINNSLPLWFWYFWNSAVKMIVLIIVCPSLPKWYLPRVPSGLFKIIFCINIKWLNNVSLLVFAKLIFPGQCGKNRSRFFRIRFHRQRRYDIFVGVVCKRQTMVIQLARLSLKCDMANIILAISSGLYDRLYRDRQVEAEFSILKGTRWNCAQRFW